MALHSRELALATVLLLAGCSGVLPGNSIPAPLEAQIVGTTATGGQCVDTPMTGLVVESTSDDGVRTVSVAGNVTVPGAHYAVDDFSLTQVGPTRYRLDVNTTESEQKPAHECPNGGIVHYEVTMELPETDGFELEIGHDGQPVSGVGGGGES